MFLPCLSGLAVQRFGERPVLLMTLLSIVAGQLVFCLSVQTRVVTGMILGRVLVGIGGETMGVLGSEITTRWFQDKQLSFALALNLGGSRLGSVANSMLVPGWTEASGVVSASWMGTVLPLGVTLLSCLYLLRLSDVAGPEASSNPPGFISSVSRFNRIYWQLGIVCVLGYGGINTFTNSAQRFLAAWFYKGDQRAAGSATSIPYILSGILVPPVGFLLDLPWFRSPPRSLVLSHILMVAAHLMFLFKIGPILPLIFLGTAYALYGVAFWAGLARCLCDLSVPTGSGNTSISGIEHHDPYGTLHSSDHVPRPSNNEEEHSVKSTEEEAVDKGLITLGYGIMTSLLNLTTALVPVLLAGTENAAGFSGPEMVFLALAAVGCIASARLA
ncbi:hypothetical protein ABOM_001983 [Aspergillus bombycis]|uniref:Lysosomal dipeptide transporter MFSD1 n=1 Tax=Aspergillus bombycis TaxID=109264 RepID=A0A1F8AAC2_9EURO|nr:hypothetical protein ABOM_001983 [Aspergillus bombycis]OGM48676.1 hypothetical protein ABOM_001983 [Aspergillus bombycis]